MQAREDAAVFDVSRLVDFSERVLLECPAAQLTPLVREPGRCARQLPLGQGPPWRTSPLRLGCRAGPLRRGWARAPTGSGRAAGARSPRPACRRRRAPPLPRPAPPRRRLVVTERRLYFQPLHNVAGDSPVRSHPLAAVAAVARRRHALQPLGLELFFLDAAAAAAAAGGLAGPAWDGPSAFFALRCARGCWQLVPHDCARTG